MNGNWHYSSSISARAGRIAELANAWHALGMQAPLLVTDPGLGALPIGLVLVGKGLVKGGSVDVDFRYDALYSYYTQTLQTRFTLYTRSQFFPVNLDITHAPPSTLRGIDKQGLVRVVAWAPTSPHRCLFAVGIAGFSRLVGRNWAEIKGKQGGEPRISG